MINEKSSVVNISTKTEDGKDYIQVDEKSVLDAWYLTRDWKDIISNDENLKILADLNMTSPQRIVALTEIVSTIMDEITHHTGNTYHDTVIRVIENIDED